MINFTIDRWQQHDCTPGRLSVSGSSFQCFTLELPWRGNQPDVSCIPKGEYEYYYRLSPKNGKVLELRNVPDRTYIQVHSGNFTRQIQGCILVGDAIKFLDSDTIPDVTNSRITLDRLLNEIPRIGRARIF